jgi:chromosome segregation ATPase
MAFICCATPSELYLEETRSTLRFAANAKMVKTRPKINMVTDDKSRIRQLEKELAESMKQCTEANDKLQERLTSDAAMDYDVQRKKISQITSILLNYNPAPSKTAHASKRRLSEGIAFPRDESTSQIGAQASLTQPRPFKRVRVQKSEPLASSFELSLAKEALALKGQALKLSVQSRAELQESLASSLARSQEVESRLSSELDALRKDFEQAVKERDAGKIKIQEVIKNATKEQEALQEKQGALVLEKEELQLQLVKVTSRYELEKTQLVEQRDSADRIREDLERKVEILESDLSASRVEREELLAKSSSVEQESVVLKQELELSISLSRTVEEKNAVIKASLEKETSQFEAEKLKLHEEMAALLQVKEAAEQNITVLQDELASLSQLRDNLSNELEAIKRVHVTLEATTKNQEALLTERTTQLELTRKLLDEATQEAVSLKEQFETDQLAATRAMENLKADLASAQADSNTAFDSLQEMQVRYTSVASERDLIKSNLEEVNKCLTLALEREEKQKTVLGLLQGSTSELQSQIVSLESELQKSKLEYDDTERHYSATRTELERVLRENSDISAKHETLRRSYDSLEQQWAQLNNEYASSQECLSSKTLALESTTQSLLHHQRTSESLVVQNAKFSDEISRLKEALSECQSALASATKDLLSTRSEEESKARMLSEKLEVVESLLAENKELNDKWNLSQRDLTVALSQIDILSKRKDELESSLSEIQESQAQLIGEHEVTLSNFQSATDQIDRLKAELNEKVELLNKMMVEKASMQEQVASLTASENDLIQSNTDLRDRNIALVHELSEARSSGATDRTRFTDLSLALEAASRSRALIETELSEAMTEKEDLQGRMSALQMEYEKCTAEWQSSKMLLEDAQQKINSLELLDKAQVEQRDMLEDQNRRLKAQIQAIENRNQILEDSLVTAESKAKALASSVSTLEKDKLDIQNDANHRKNEVDSLTTEVELLRAQIETYLAHQIELKRQLDSAHGLLEVSNTQLRQKQASVYELEDQLTSMGNMLNECNALLDEKTAKISELEQHLATKTEPDESTILVGSLNKQVNSLTDECAEVKLLLASANEEIVLARDRASLLERQLEELRTKHELEKRSGHDTKNDLLVPELEKLRVEKAELEIVLQREVATRFQFESELKDRLGAERKSLIQEAESAMQNLRVELQTTKESLKRLGDEAYAGRQEFQELHERETAGQTKITELMHENEQLKLTIDQLGQGVKEEEILKKKVTDLKQKLCEAIDANSKLKIEAKKWKALKVTNESLRRELEAVTSSEKGGNDALAKLSEQLRLKDERIEKLEKNKFTVAHAESLKNLKVSESTFQSHHPAESVETNRKETDGLSCLLFSPGVKMRA